MAYFSMRKQFHSMCLSQMSDRHPSLQNVVVADTTLWCVLLIENKVPLQPLIYFFVCQDKMFSTTLRLNLCSAVQLTNLMFAKFLGHRHNRHHLQQCLRQNPIKTTWLAYFLFLSSSNY